MADWDWIVYEAAPGSLLTGEALREPRKPLRTVRIATRRWFDARTQGARALGKLDSEVGLVRTDDAPEWLRGATLTVTLTLQKPRRKPKRRHK